MLYHSAVQTVPCASWLVRQSPLARWRLARTRTDANAARRLAAACGLIRPLCTIHHLRAPDRRCRWPLVMPRGRPTFCTSRKCSARMGTRGTGPIDRRYTQVSIKGGREQGRQGRERSTRWCRGGGEAWCTPKKSPLSMNWAACKRIEGARSNASRMPKKPMTGSRPEHNWRRRAGCTHGGLSGAI